MGFWPYLRHAHGSDNDAPPSATGISRTTFFSWLFLLPNHSRGGEKEKRAEINFNFERNLALRSLSASNDGARRQVSVVGWGRTSV